MVEKVTDLWTEECDARCITTNGFIKNNGNLVMGAGVAGQAQERYPFFPKVAGKAVKEYGNMVHVFRDDWLVPNTMFYKQDHQDRQWFITFPVKHVWYEKADLDLIEKSAHELMELIDEPGFSFMKKVLLPIPGCGNGGRSWSEVKPVLTPILDDRVWVINNKPFDWPASF